MNKFLQNEIFILASRVFIGLIFIIAGMEKIIAPEEFAISISNYKILPDFSLNIFAIIIPWIEVVTGLFMMFNIQSKENSFIVLNLYILFTVMIIIAVLRGLDIDCGCFGTNDGQQVGLIKIIENLLQILIVFNIFRNSNKSKNNISLI